MTKLTLLAAVLALSGCAATPLRVANAEGAIQTDAAIDAPLRGKLVCPAPPGDTSVRAARCARAQIMRTLGPSIPSLAY